MRINKYLALATGMSRRAADIAIVEGRVLINGKLAEAGQQVAEDDVVIFDGSPLKAQGSLLTIMLNKPVGYVVSRDGQGNKTIYDLLPDELQALKPVGRLDKDSSGLLLLTNNGQLGQELTHPSFKKRKIYKIALDKPLLDGDKIKIEAGVELEDGPSSLKLSGKDKDWTVTMREGRNRQIRRTFAALGYRAQKLHRTQFGPCHLNNLPSGKFVRVKI